MGVYIKIDPTVKKLWEFRVDWGCEWNECSNIMKHEHEINISTEDAEMLFVGFFENIFSDVLYTACPKCGEGEIVPRKSTYGYFASCSTFPDCTYKSKNKNMALDEGGRK